MKTRSLVLAAAIVSFAGLAACSHTAESGTSYTITPDRNLSFHVPVDLKTAHNAGIGALSDLGFTMESEKADMTEGVVKGKTARGDAVVVETFKEGDKLTKVDVFVGPMGDEPKMEELMRKIEARVK